MGRGRTGPTGTGSAPAGVGDGISASARAGREHDHEYERRAGHTYMYCGLAHDVVTVFNNSSLKSGTTASQHPWHPGEPGAVLVLTSESTQVLESKVGTDSEVG